jgi:hypothetical protein
MLRQTDIKRFNLDDLNWYLFVAVFALVLVLFLRWLFLG